jgi:hypothetical protein
MQPKSRQATCWVLQDNRRLGEEIRQARALCDEQNDIATAALLENWTDEAEDHALFSYEGGRTGKPPDCGAAADRGRKPRCEDSRLPKEFCRRS